MKPGLPVWRSLLYVPVNVEKYVDKAHTRGADCIQVDLEDSVPAAEKDRARKPVPAVAARVSGGGPDGATHGLDTQPLGQPAGPELAAHHPDRTGECRWLRHYDVGCHGDEVASRTGQVTHRHDDRRAGLTSDAHPMPDGVRGDVRPPRPLTA